jgi:hypothetical protein
MKLTITIDKFDTAAMDDAPGAEVTQLLAGVARQFFDQADGTPLTALILSGVLRDSNGARVGTWGFES